MTESPIAVVGLASLLPGSDDVAGYWRALLEGSDCLSDVPEQYWRIADYFDPTPRARDKTYARRGGFIAPQPFDTLAFGIPPSNLPATDVAQLLALVLAQRCLADADQGPTPRFDRRRTSVILGTAPATQLMSHMSGRMARPMWREGLRRSGLDEASIERACDAIADQFVPWQESTFPGLLGNVIAGRIANRFDLGGTNCVLDAACASSLAALQMAIGELRSGRTDTVLTGGVDALNDVLMFLCFSQTPALSPTGHCRPFSDKADGTMLGEGVAMLALRRLDEAERDGHRIYAVIRGIGSSSDGRATSVYAPRAQGQALALRRAYEDAGYGPETVELVEAHGTGTTAGDAAEFAALKDVFGAAAPDRRQWCALGSVKSQIGHTKAAAGAASLVKTVLSLHHRVLPPTIKVDRPNPALGFDSSPFYLNTAARPWLHDASFPRRASVSSAGFGGSNFHVTLEEYRGPARAAEVDASPTRLLLFAGADDEAVLGAVAVAATELRTAAQLAAYARRSHEQFAVSAAVRAAILIDGVDQLDAASRELTSLLAGGEPHARGTYAIVRRGAPARSGEVALLFPGQGSQYVGMGRELAVYFPAAFEAWERANRAAADIDGPRLGEVVFPPPAFDDETRAAQASRLRATSAAQPALAAASLAPLALLQAIGIRPAAVAGHSFGELVALHAAGSFDADALVRLAHLRGAAMAACAGGDEAGDAGGMLAVAAGAPALQALLDRGGDDGCVLANDNHPRQAVVSGSTASLRRIEPQLAAAGFSYQTLPVAAAFHSPLVAAAGAQFSAAVDAVVMVSPSLPVIANATAQPYPAEPIAVKAQLARQLAEPVRFRESIDAMYALGCRIFVEVGAGCVLTGLVARCLADRPHVAIATDQPGVHGVRAWWQAIAELSTLGLPLTLEALHRAHGPAAPIVPTPSGSAVVHLAGTNVGKPYPPAAAPARPPVPAATPVPQLSTTKPSVTAPAAATRPTAQKASQIAMSDRPSPAAPPALHQQDLHARILDAQRLTQQAILESFSMTLRSIGGTGVTVSALPAPALMPAAAPPALLHGATLTAPDTSARVATTSAPPAPAPAAPASFAAPAQPARASVPAAAPVTAPAAAMPPRTTPPAAAQPPVPQASGDAAARVLAIIADKTGYPVEALGREMELEADLGIDSIKRVEILSAVSREMPSLDASRIAPADVRRISDLLALLEEGSADPQPAAAR